MTVSRFDVPDLGIGVGYRPRHYAEVLEDQPAMDFFEVLSENFMVDGGVLRRRFEGLVERYPVVAHGVSLNLGAEGDPEHLRRLVELVQCTGAAWASDHLCYTGSHGANTHDLLPVPYNAEVLEHMVERIRRVQDALGVVLAIENPSSYLEYADSTMTEWGFLSELVERADCGVLLDVNNVFVSARNHGFDPVAYLDAVPADRVVQIHLAGHSIRHGFLLDTHDAPVCDEVWELYAHAIRRLGSITTLIEWDGNVPELSRLQEEAERARATRDEALGVSRAA